MAVTPGVQALLHHGVEWDTVNIVKVRDNKVVGQWAQPDLWGIYRQLTAP